MLVATLLLTVTIFILNRAVRGAVAPYQDYLKTYGFAGRFLAPCGLLVVQKLPFIFTGAYNRRARTRLALYYGARRAREFWTVHNAQRAVLVLISLVVFGFWQGIFGLDWMQVLLWAVLQVPLWCINDYVLSRKIRQRRDEIITALPTFLTALALLLNAGMPFTAAVQKILAGAPKTNPLYGELARVTAEISTGRSIHQAYEEMKRNCQVPEVTRFVALVLQNLNRGNADLAASLQSLARESWERRKDVARRLGEEASSKLVIPMIMVFVAIGIIVLAPALMGLGSP